MYTSSQGLERALEQVSKDVVWWVLRKRGIKELVVKLVQLMYRTDYGQVRQNGSCNTDPRCNPISTI